jgi:hypothetical protein
MLRRRSAPAGCTTITAFLDTGAVGEHQQRLEVCAAPLAVIPAALDIEAQRSSERSGMGAATPVSGVAREPGRAQASA